MDVDEFRLFDHFAGAMGTTLNSWFRRVIRGLNFGIFQKTSRDAENDTATKIAVVPRVLVFCLL